VVDDEGFEAGIGRGENEEGALGGGRMKEDEGGDQLGEGEAGGDDHQSAVRVVQEVSDYELVELDHGGADGETAAFFCFGFVSWRVPSWVWAGLWL
jgi:hypothetical protein